MKRKIVIGSVIVVMVIGVLLGCGQDSGSKDESIESNLSEEGYETSESVALVTTPAPAEIPEATEEPGVPVITQQPEATEEPTISASAEGAEISGENGDETPTATTDKIQASGDLSNVEANEQIIIDTIINDLAVYNQFIYDHCGYPESVYGDGPHAKEANPDLYIFCLENGIMEYMDLLINYISGDYNPDEPMFLWAQLSHYASVEEQIEEIRGCVFTQTPYNQAHPEDFQNYTMILKNFLEDGHPDIEKIDTITIEWIDYFYEFDSKLCDVIATFTSNGETYKCYLNATEVSADGAYYTVLDLERVDASF